MVRYKFGFNSGDTEVARFNSEIRFLNRGLTFGRKWRGLGMSIVGEVL